MVMVVLQITLIFKMLRLHVKGIAKNQVSRFSVIEHSANLSTSMHMYLKCWCKTLPSQYSVASEIVEQLLSCFPKVAVYDPLRKWMDNCYRGVPLGGLG